MTPGTRRSMHRISAAGQCLLILLSISWAVFERRAPFVNVRWRDGLSTEARRQAEIQLYLENGEPAGEAWRYELASPRTADIAAIIVHPDVQDTHRIERHNATISADAGRGELRVWWAGPFKGAHSRLEFRAVFGVIGIITLFCASFSRRRSAGPRKDSEEASFAVRL
jgi:hypothetical protein